MCVFNRGEHGLNMHPAPRPRLSRESRRAGRRTRTAAGSTLAIPSPSRRSHRHAASGLAARGWQSSGNARQTAQMQGSAAAETSSALLPDSEQSADAGSAWAGSGQERAQVRGGAGSVGASVPSRKQFLFNQMIRSSYHRLVSRIIGRASSGRGRRVLQGGHPCSHRHVLASTGWRTPPPASC